MSNYGMKVSKKGYGVHDPSLVNFLLHSGKSCLKQVIKGSVAVTGDGTKAEATITHNLGYAPMFMAFIRKGTENKWFSLSVQMWTWKISGVPIESFSGFTNSNDLTLTLQPAPSGQQYTFYYFIFVDKVV